MEEIMHACLKPWCKNVAPPGEPFCDVCAGRVWDSRTAQQKRYLHSKAVASAEKFYGRLKRLLSPFGLKLDLMRVSERGHRVEFGVTLQACGSTISIQRALSVYELTNKPTLIGVAPLMAQECLCQMVRLLDKPEVAPDAVAG